MGTRKGYEHYSEIICSRYRAGESAKSISESMRLSNTFILRVLRDAAIPIRDARYTWREETGEWLKLTDRQRAMRD